MLQSAVERIFGIFKRRFPILTKPLEYSFCIQGQLVICLAVIHNHIMLDAPLHVEDFLEADHQLSKQDPIYSGEEDDETLLED